MEDTGGELLAVVVIGNSLGSDDRLGVLLNSEVVELVLSSGGVETTVLATETGGDTTNIGLVATVVELATREMLVESKSASTAAAGRHLGDISIATIAVLNLCSDHPCNL